MEKKRRERQPEGWGEARRLYTLRQDASDALSRRDVFGGVPDRQAVARGNLRMRHFGYVSIWPGQLQFRSGRNSGTSDYF